MGKITCKHCGTRYPDDVAKCPICGASNAPNVSEGFEFLDDEFEATAAGESVQTAEPDGAGAPAASEEQAKPEKSEQPVSQDTGNYNWEDILAEIKGKKPEADEPAGEKAPAEPKQAAKPAAAPARKQSDAEQNTADEETPEPERPARLTREREKKKNKKGGAVLAVILALIVIAAAAFAAKQAGLFDKKAPEEEQETPELPVVQETDVDCTGVTLSAAELLLTKEGESQTLTVTVQPEDCTEKVNWLSADPSVAVVDAAGTVTAVAEGKSNILVSCGDYAATCIVTVNYTPEDEEGEEEDPENAGGEGEETGDGEMKLNFEDITIRYPGEQAQLEVENCGDKPVTWTSENETILKVDEKGLVTGLGTGTTTVRAEVDGQTFSCIVRLPLGGVEGEAITVTLDKTDITMFYVGEQVKLEVEYEQGAPEGVTYEWHSDDEAVCTVDADGIITAVSNGTANVTTVADGVTLRCIVRVRFDTTTETPTTEG